ncbi:DUF692 domain-containing protein [Citreimonas sp.]|uniref:MNIO family bufferin maturase n=1 Tax=Citreimonas sp. TaxID=3036715 RepID=UPI0035C876B6
MNTTLPDAPGVGFKTQHRADLDDPGPVSWLEIHAENYMSDGGPRMAMLDEIARRFPLSIHGVGLSIGGEAPLDRDHLARLRRLVERVNPASFSEHLAWSTHDGAYLSDLLPLPYTDATLDRVARHIDEVQQALGLRMLLENPSSYLAFAESTYAETDFLAEIARRTGCGMLLDINNVFVSAANLQVSATDYLDAYPLDAVGEIHLGGHAEDRDATGAPLLIDDHGAPVADPVWALYARTIARTGPLPTLIEWDNDVPPFATLRAEAARAGAILSTAVAA